MLVNGISALRTPIASKKNMRICGLVMLEAVVLSVCSAHMRTVSPVATWSGVMIVSIGLTIRGVGPAGLPTPPIRSRRLIRGHNQGEIVYLDLER